MTKSVLVTGAAGYLGSHLSARLTGEGHRVVALVQADDKLLGEAAGMDIHRGSITSQQDLYRAAEGVDAIVNCAVIMPDKDDAIHLKTYYEVNVEGPKLILEAAAELDVERVILISTAGVLKVDPRKHLADDDGPLRKGYNRYLRSKIELEEWLSAPEGPSYRNWTVLRPSSLYGPGLSFKWPQVIELTKSRKMKMFGHGSALHPHVHVSDLVEAIHRCLTCPIENIRGERITITSPEEISVRDVGESLADYFKTPMPQRVPAGFALAASYVAALIPPPLRTERLRLLTPGNVREYTRDRRYDTSKAKRLLDFEAHANFRDEMVRMFESYPMNGSGMVSEFNGK